MSPTYLAEEYFLMLLHSVLALFISASAFLANGISALRYRMGNITVAGIFSMGFGGVNIVSMLGILQGVSVKLLYSQSTANFCAFRTQTVAYTRTYSLPILGSSKSHSSIWYSIPLFRPSWLRLNGTGSLRIANSCASLRRSACSALLILSLCLQNTVYH